ncbi:MAG: NnrS family protein [Octadecabacter sp.]|nr:NnrS family protein [Octadecabacter sp.]
MKQSTAEQMRQWRGPAIFSFGFRPLFLLACLWATVAMVLWIAMLAGWYALPTDFDPVTWHAHEFLFGYVSAVVAGFLLTAVPNWTGRLPVVGWPLAGLSALWLLGRLAIATSAYFSTFSVAVVDLAFLLVMWMFLLREIIAGKKWANLPVLILLAVLIFANAIFHIEGAQSGAASQGYGLRLGLAAVLVLIMLIGGKVTPSFTRNWLVKRGETALPSPPMRRFDKAVLVVSGLVLLAWVIAPTHGFVGVALLGIGVLHTVRLIRWQGHKTTGEPLVFVLHVGYAFIPLGALANALSIVSPHLISHAAALHIWTAGAIGLMTVAVMTRASLGHSGRALHAEKRTMLIYAALVAATFTRLAADLFMDFRSPLLNGTAVLWVVGFAGFVAIYGPLLIKQKSGTEI